MGLPLANLQGGVLIRTAAAPSCAFRAVCYGHVALHYNGVQGGRTFLEMQGAAHRLEEHKCRYSGHMMQRYSNALNGMQAPDQHRDHRDGAGDQHCCIQPPCTMTGRCAAVLPQHSDGASGAAHKAQPEREDPRLVVVPPRTVVSNLAEARLNARLRSVRSATRGQSFLLQVRPCARACTGKGTWQCSCAGPSLRAYQPMSDSLACACKGGREQSSIK